jgi:IS1 family transposase
MLRHYVLAAHPSRRLGLPGGIGAEYRTATIRIRNVEAMPVATWSQYLHTLKLKQLLEPFGITTFYTDGWGAYERHIEAEKHHVGKENTQKIESKHINLRTRIKRLVRRTICFSKTEQMHDLVIGLFVNRYEFGLPL